MTTLQTIGILALLFCAAQFVLVGWMRTIMKWQRRQDEEILKMLAREQLLIKDVQSIINHIGHIPPK